VNIEKLNYTFPVRWANNPDLQTLNAELERLNARAAELASVISHNVQQIVGL